MKNRFALLLTLMLLVGTAYSQTKVVNNPSVAQQSHSELKIEEILFYPDSTVVLLSVTNQLPDGGWFCADKNTYIADAHGDTRRYLVSVRGIPWCPSVHSFKSMGEVLRFSLIFPSIPDNILTMNLIEQCERACFSFRGIILDEKLNNDIRLFDEGVKLYANNEFEKALQIFARIVEEIPPSPTHVYGYSYYNLIKISKQLGKTDMAQNWIKQLSLSGLPNRDYFLEMVNRD